MPQAIRNGQIIEITEEEAAAATPVLDLNAMDQQALNAALTEEGSVVRALALVLLQEINILRQKAALPQYTQTQLVAALKAKMR